MDEYQKAKKARIEQHQTPVKNGTTTRLDESWTRPMPPTHQFLKQGLLMALWRGAGMPGVRLQLYL